MICVFFLFLCVSAVTHFEAAIDSNVSGRQTLWIHGPYYELKIFHGYWVNHNYSQNQIIIMIWFKCFHVSVNGKAHARFVIVTDEIKIIIFVKKVY